MPGFTSECQTGHHEACNVHDCRCACHPWTQALLKIPVKKSDLSGGIRRDVVDGLPITTYQDQLLNPTPQKSPEVHNTCPQCGAHAAATDIFCRKDGTRLVMGMQCSRCGAPEEPGDSFCWQCGLRAGEKWTPPEPQPELTVDERVQQIRELARKKGLLKETTV